jgi:hypothetical protein
MATSRTMLLRWFHFSPTTSPTVVSPLLNPNRANEKSEPRSCLFNRTSTGARYSPIPDSEILLRAYRTNGVLVRHLSGNPTYQDLARVVRS